MSVLLFVDHRLEQLSVICHDQLRAFARVEKVPTQHWQFQHTTLITAQTLIDPIQTGVVASYHQLIFCNFRDSLLEISLVKTVWQPQCNNCRFSKLSKEGAGDSMRALH